MLRHDTTQGPVSVTLSSVHPGVCGLTLVVVIIQHMTCHKLCGSLYQKPE